MLLDVGVCDRNARVPSKLFQLEPGVVNTGFSENGLYLIRVPEPGAELLIDDRPMQPVMNGEFWSWEPGFFAGRVMASLFLNERFEPVNYELDVSPRPDKLGLDQYLSLVEDIVEFDPALILGTEPGRMGFSGQADESSLWVTYVRLKAYGPKLIRALRQIVELPLTRSEPVRTLSPLSRVKRIDQGTIRQVAQSASLASALWPGVSGNERSSRDSALLNVPSYEVTFNHPANHAVRGLLIRLLSATRALGLALTNYQERDPGAATELAPRIPVRLEFVKRIEADFRAFLTEPPFEELSGSEISAAGLTAISAHPAYARSYDLGSRILKKGIFNKSDDEWHYLSPTWQIYESWCFVALAKALQRRYPDANWVSSGKRPAMRFSNKEGHPPIRLLAQHTCPSLRQSGQGYRSISKERVPDIIVEYGTARVRKFVCLDAKYRTARENVLDAMTSAHVYHDALRLEDQKPTLSLLLCPHAKEVAELASEEYRRKSDVGVVSMVTNEDADKLVDLLLPTFGENVV